MLWFDVEEAEEEEKERKREFPEDRPTCSFSARPGITPFLPEPVLRGDPHSRENKFFNSTQVSQLIARLMNTNNAAADMRRSLIQKRQCHESYTASSLNHLSDLRRNSLDFFFNYSFCLIDHRFNPIMELLITSVSISDQIYSDLSHIRTNFLMKTSETDASGTGTSESVSRATNHIEKVKKLLNKTMQEMIQKKRTTKFRTRCIQQNQSQFEKLLSRTAPDRSLQIVRETDNIQSIRHFKASVDGTVNPRFRRSAGYEKEKLCAKEFVSARRVEPRLKNDLKKHMEVLLATRLNDKAPKNKSC